MRANVKCISCMFDKQVRMTNKFSDESRKKEYLCEVRSILNKFGDSESSPEISERLSNLYSDFWKTGDEYEDVKKKYNMLLLGIEDRLTEKIKLAGDTIKECIKYVCAANYIDFSAVKNVSEETFSLIMEKAGKEHISEKECERFKKDLADAGSLVYLTDNCGEVVVDKIFIKFIRALYPDLRITAILRGENTLNDATVRDAEETGLADIVKCIGNGNGAPETVIKKFSSEARKCMDTADVIISKGQGNFEGLFGEGYNQYYLFLCKCDLFVDRFGLKQFSTIFAREDTIMDFNPDIKRR